MNAFANNIRVLREQGPGRRGILRADNPAAAFDLLMERRRENGEWGSAFCRADWHKAARDRCSLFAAWTRRRGFSTIIRSGEGTNTRDGNLAPVHFDFGPQT